MRARVVLLSKGPGGAARRPQASRGAWLYSIAAMPTWPGDHLSPYEGLAEPDHNGPRWPPDGLRPTGGPGRGGADAGGTAPACGRTPPRARRGHPAGVVNRWRASARVRRPADAGGPAPA